ncbi:MAG: hypothetical protein OHK0012_06790 [Synechococcales cyanobacterium]
MWGLCQQQVLRVATTATAQQIEFCLTHPQRQAFWPLELVTDASRLETGSQFILQWGEAFIGSRVDQQQEGYITWLLWGAIDGWMEWRWGNGWIQLRWEGVTLLPLGVAIVWVLHQLQSHLPHTSLPEPLDPVASS